MSSLLHWEPAADAVARSAPSRVAVVVAAMGGEDSVWDDGGCVHVEQRWLVCVDDESFTEHRRWFTPNNGLDRRR